MNIFAVTTNGKSNPKNKNPAVRVGSLRPKQFRRGTAALAQDYTKAMKAEESLGYHLMNISLQRRQLDKPLLTITLIDDYPGLNSDSVDTDYRKRGGQ